MTLCGIIVLAAGGSSRLGQPKQLLPYKQKSLLRNTLLTAIGASIGQLVVVLGCGAEKLKPEIPATGAAVVVNPEWQKGMASSLVTGLKKLLLLQPLTDAVIVMTCDQPFVASLLLQQLVTKQRETGKLIVTSNYGDAIGPPALFHKDLFDELFQLQGDRGAKWLVQQYIDDTVHISFPLGNIDIDTKEEYEALLQEKNDIP